MVHRPESGEKWEVEHTLAPHRPNRHSPGHCSDGIFLYRIDAQLRRTTLFEVVGPWQEISGRVWTVEVEHPGVEHILTVSPFVGDVLSAALPVTLRCRFGEAGGSALVETTTHYEVVRKSHRSSSFTWRTARFDFTPTRIGRHELIVESIDGIVPPLLHLRIADPENRNGRRVPGYRNRTTPGKKFAVSL